MRAKSVGSYTVEGSDAASIQMGEHQIAQGQGPALDAMRDGAVVAVADLSAEQRWNGYGAHGTSLGARSSMSLTIHRESNTFGALTLYAFESAAQLGHQQAEAAAIAGREARTIELAMQMAEQAD